MCASREVGPEQQQKRAIALISFLRRLARAKPDNVLKRFQPVGQVRRRNARHGEVQRVAKDVEHYFHDNKKELTSTTSAILSCAFPMASASAGDLTIKNKLFFNKLLDYFLEMVLLKYFRLKG